jgi:carbonic anhydrase
MPVMTAAPTIDAAKDALERLILGNERFREGRSLHRHEAAHWRSHLVEGQQPFATILGCADSRIPPELVFDQGFGDLFVIRVAGNVIGEEVAGSIQYAVAHLRTPLLVVLGHEGCGAVTAAVEAALGKHDEPHYIEALIGLIRPGLQGLDLTLDEPLRLNAAVEANVRWSVRQLAETPGGRRILAEQRGMLVGAVYELASGSVRFLDRSDS